MRIVNIDYNPLRRSTSARYDAEHMGLRREQIGLQKESLRLNTNLAYFNSGLALVQAGAQLVSAIDNRARQIEIKQETLDRQRLKTIVDLEIENGNLRIGKGKDGLPTMFRKVVDPLTGEVSYEEGVSDTFTDALKKCKKEAGNKMRGLQIGNYGRYKKTLNYLEEEVLTYALGKAGALTLDESIKETIENCSMIEQLIVNENIANMEWDSETQSFKVTKTYEGAEKTDEWNAQNDEIQIGIDKKQAEINIIREQLDSDLNENSGRFEEVDSEQRKTLIESLKQKELELEELEKLKEEHESKPDYKPGAHINPEYIASYNEVIASTTEILSGTARAQMIKQSEQNIEKMTNIGLAGKLAASHGTAEARKFIDSLPEEQKAPAIDAMNKANEQRKKEAREQTQQRIVDLQAQGEGINVIAKDITDMRNNEQNQEAREVMSKEFQEFANNYFYGKYDEGKLWSPAEAQKHYENWLRNEEPYMYLHTDDGIMKSQHASWFASKGANVRSGGGGGSKDTSEDDMWAYVRRYEDGVDPIEIAMQNLEQYREHKPKLYGELRDRLLTQHNMGAAPAMINFLNALDLYKGQKPKDNATQAEKDAYLRRQNEIEILKKNALREYQALKRGEDMDKILNEGSKRYIGRYVEEMMSGGRLAKDTMEWGNQTEQGMFEMMYMGHSGALNLTYGAKIDDPRNPYKETEQIAGGENAKKALIANAEYGLKWMNDQFEKYDIKINGQVLKANLTENSYQKDIIGYERDGNGNIKKDKYGKPIPIYGKGLTGEVHYFDQFGNRYRINVDQQTDKNGKVTKYVNERVERFVNNKWERYNPKTKDWEN